MFFEGVCELLHTQHSFRLYAVAIVLMRNGSWRPLGFWRGVNGSRGRALAAGDTANEAARGGRPLYEGT
jgi:hypothetical protein